MVNIQPETENATTLSDSSVEHEDLLSEPGTSDSIHEDAAGSSKRVADTPTHTLHSPSQSPNKRISSLSGNTANFTENAPAGAVSNAPKYTSKTSSQPVCKDESILSMESDEEISRLSENSSIRNIPSDNIKTTLEVPPRPTFRDGSSLSSVSDEEISGSSENLSSRIVKSKENDISKKTVEAPPRPVCRNGSSSSLDSEAGTSSMSLSVVPFEDVGNSLRQNLSAPTCKDGSSLSLYSDEETGSVSETALATVTYASEIESSSSESDIEEDNVLSQLPQNLVAQTPQVLVDNSSDVHIGPHFQYTGPITVKQYITLKGREAIESDSSLSSSKVPTEMPHLKEIVNIALKPQGKEGNKDDSDISEVLTDVSYAKNMNNFVINANYSPKLSNNVNNMNNGMKSNGIHVSEDVLLSGSKVTLLKAKKKILKMKYVVICLFVLIILCICIALSLVLPGKIYSSKDVIVPQNINMSCEFKNLKVSEGDKLIQWAVNITSSIGRLKVDWYGPGCKLIEPEDGPSKYKIENIYPENGKMVTVLKVLNVTQSDRGLYKLHVYNDKDEQWDYYSLTVGGGHIVACYMAEWAHLRQGRGIFTVEDIDPTQCTHLLYAFAKLNIENNTIYASDPAYDLGSEHEIGAYEKITSLKKKHPNLKVLISMGGWDERLKKNYSVVAESADRRKEFIASVVDFIEKHNFDGFDLHWQYPTEEHGRPPDKQNFVYLVKELREEFDKQGKGWLLTAPLGVIPNTIKSAYSIPEITQYLHYMFALCYAYHGYWDLQTGPNAPLYRSKAGDELNVQASIEKLLELGAKREKLVLGLPLYGRNYILENEKDSIGFGARTVGNGFIGPFVQEDGTWGYNEICEELERKRSSWVLHWDNVTHTPYMTNKEKFMSYDNERSLTDKVEFALLKNLAGVVAYSLDTDDFRGVCASDRSGATNYPLMRAINKAFLTSSYGAMEPCVNAYKLKPTSKAVD